MQCSPRATVSLETGKAAAAAAAARRREGQLDNECADVGDTYLLTVILCDSFSARGLLAGIRLPIESSISFFEPLQSHVLSEEDIAESVNEAEVAFRTLCNGDSLQRDCGAV